MQKVRIRTTRPNTRLVTSDVHFISLIGSKTLCGIDVHKLDSNKWQYSRDYVTCQTCNEAAINEKMESDPVNNPAHYTSGKIEVIDFIEDQKLNFPRGNAVKYIARAGKKDPAKEVEDLEKAVWYLNRDIQALKNK